VNTAKIAVLAAIRRRRPGGRSAGVSVATAAL
jgi:hypothetical protein